MSRLERLLQLLQTGKLASIAAASPTRHEFLAAIQLSPQQWDMARGRFKVQGLYMPTIAELRATGRAAAKASSQPPSDAESSAQAEPEHVEDAAPDHVDPVDEFASEEQTDPGVGGWSRLEPNAQRWTEPPQPEDNIPPGHVLRGISTEVREDGTVTRRWIKTRKSEQDRYESLLAAMEGIGDAWRGLAEPAVVPNHSNDDLLCVYPMGDPHLGMYAWAQETGNDFDLGMAERNLCGAVDRLVGLAPSASEGLIVNLGDFFHADNTSNRTNASGHALDVDTRWAKVLSAGVRTMRRCIDRALEKHRKVTVINAIGNHDDHSSVMLSVALSQYYEREPRVLIDTSPQLFHWYRFGDNLIGVHHGHTAKPERLLGVMVSDRAADWGETRHRFFYCGHIHHDTLKEMPGNLIIETFRTLAGRDAWHHGQGYRADRDMKVDVIHRRWGRIQRHIVGIDQVCAA
jgi:hypothetical protein